MLLFIVVHQWILSGFAGMAFRENQRQGRGADAARMASCRSQYTWLLPTKGQDCSHAAPPQTHDVASGGTKGRWQSLLRPPPIIISHICFRTSLRFVWCPLSSLLCSSSLSLSLSLPPSLFSSFFRYVNRCLRCFAWQCSTGAPDRAACPPTQTGTAASILCPVSSFPHPPLPLHLHPLHCPGLLGTSQFPRCAMKPSTIHASSSSSSLYWCRCTQATMVLTSHSSTVRLCPPLASSTGRRTSARWTGTMEHAARKPPIWSTPYRDRYGRRRPEAGHALL